MSQTGNPSPPSGADGTSPGDGTPPDPPLADVLERLAALERAVRSQQSAAPLSAPTASVPATVPASGKTLTLIKAHQLHAAVFGHAHLWPRPSNLLQLHLCHCTPPCQP